MPVNNGEQRPFQIKYWISFRFLSWLATFLTFALIFKYTLTYWILLSCGFITCLCIVLYFIINDNLMREINDCSQIPKRFSFVNEKAWNIEHDELFKDAQKLNEPIIKESFLISETLDDFINLVINEFIDTWFEHISKSNIFQDSIRQELRHVIRNLKERLMRRSFADLLVFHILPIINEHFNQFVNLEHNNRLSGNFCKIPVAPINNTLQTARQYDRGRIHSGVTISIDSNNTNEKKHLRKKIETILPYLLSSRENRNIAGTSLIKELLASTVLTRIIQLLGDSDLYNLLIVNLIGDNLKHREQVKQLRAALEEHTRLLGRGTSLRNTSISKPSRHLQNYKKISKNCIVCGSMNKYSFNEALINISKIKNISELQNLLQYTEYELSKVKNEIHASSDEVTILLSRLELLKAKIGDKITHLSDSTGRKLQKYNVESLMLQDILNNSVGLRSFSEFVNDRSRALWLQLWLAIDSIKAPLEDIDIQDDGEARLSLSLEFSSLEDITAIYDEFFHNSNLEIDSEVFNIVEKCVFNHDPFLKLELYKRARKALFKLQNSIYGYINENDFPQFKKSELFFKLIETHALDSKPVETNSPISWSTSGELKMKRVENRLDESSESEVDEVSPAVINAVQHAFNQIMHNSDGEKGDLIMNSKVCSHSSAAGFSDSTSTPVLTIHLKKTLFGESSNLFNDDIINYSNSNRNHKLFDDVSDESFSDNDSINFDSDSQTQNIGLQNPSHSDLQIFLAAPGNLRLAEEISKLTAEIESLSEQQAILTPLLKKAELTNNVGELKILRKSKVSLDREINAKELQKQQFIVQENDNSLYGKSRVSVQSYISGNENEKNFILYIVEVQKLSNDNQNSVTAGWIVARRFSQFFKLNEYLKSRYPQVTNIKFPKRTVLVLKFQHKQIVEQRKALLEEYLQELIKISDVCSNRVFRSFLSSESFTLRTSQSYNDNANDNLSKLKTSVEVVANKLYSGISGKIVPNSLLIVNNSSPISDNAVDEYMKEMQKELKQYDEAEQSNGLVKPVFVKPICDLLKSVFRLNTSKSWLRGRALLVILHNVFGNTLEKKVCEVIDLYIRTEENILDLLIWGKNTVFPMGKFMEAPQIRSSYQKSTTKQEAQVLLELFMQETCSKIFGISNTTFAHSKIFEMLQNDFLNKHLILQIFDELIHQLFPDAFSNGSA